MKNFHRFIISVILLMTIALTMVFANAQPTEVKEETVRCRVQEILSDSYDVTVFSGGEIYTRVINFRGEILNGKYKGQTLLVRQELDELGQINAYPAKEGDVFFLHLTTGERGQLTGFASDHVRSGTLALLTAAFFGGLVLFGGLKGLKTVFSLSLTVILVFCWFIPSILNGKNPVAAALLVSFVIIFATLLIVIGINQKTISALLGCWGGIAAAGIICAVSMYTMRITGLVDSDSGILMYVANGGNINLKGIVFAGIIIGALGATMDVAVSVAAALHEIAEQAVGITPRQLVRSGLSIGRDMMGTMSNTLILAYAGGSLQVILLMFSQQMNFEQLINREMVAVELLQALAGSIGMLCTIPITTVVTAWLISRKGGSGKKSALPANWPQCMPFDNDEKQL
ncbi:MAG: YibE/F family protein [Oscillospiraceae bacterium]|nr:YibE/F family protein [Oscillospiraceae bacterium]